MKNSQFKLAHWNHWLKVARPPPPPRNKKRRGESSAVKVETHRDGRVGFFSLLSCPPAFGPCLFPSKQATASYPASSRSLLLRQRYTHNNILIGCGRSMAFCRKRIVPTKISHGLLLLLLVGCARSVFRPFWSSFTENTRRWLWLAPTERRADAHTALKKRLYVFGEAEFRKRFFLLIAFLNDVTLNLLQHIRQCRCQVPQGARLDPFPVPGSSMDVSFGPPTQQQQPRRQRQVPGRDRTWVSEEAFCPRKCEKWVWIFPRRALFLRAAFFIFSHPAPQKVRRAAACPWQTDGPGRPRKGHPFSCN